MPPLPSTMGGPVARPASPRRGAADPRSLHAAPPQSRAGALIGPRASMADAPAGSTTAAARIAAQSAKIASCKHRSSTRFGALVAVEGRAVRCAPSRGARRRGGAGMTVAAQKGQARASRVGEGGSVSPPAQLPVPP